MAPEPQGTALEVRPLGPSPSGVKVTPTRAGATLGCSDCGKQLASAKTLAEAIETVRLHRCKLPGRLEFRQIDEQSPVTWLDCGIRLAVSNTFEAATRQVTSHKC